MFSSTKFPTKLDEGIVSFEEQREFSGLEGSKLARLSKDPDQKLRNLLLETEPEPEKMRSKSMSLAKRSF